MSFVKFFTVFDDEYRHILLKKKQKSYVVNAYPSVFFVDGVPYYETISAMAKFYCDSLDSGKKITKPTVPAAVFEAELKRAYDEGYMGVVIVCPNSLWTDHKHQAQLAVKRFFRKNEIDELGFKVKIIDSKQIGAAVPYLTYFFADTYFHLYQSTTDFYSFMEYFKNKPMFYVLEDGPCQFDSSSGISAFSYKSNRLKNMEISHYNDSVIYDKFAEAVVKDAIAFSRDLVISLGSDCKFGGNVIGRIERDLGKTSLCTIQYGAVTASVIGNKAICISLV